MTSSLSSTLLRLSACTLAASLMLGLGGCQSRLVTTAEAEVEAPIAAPSQADLIQALEVEVERARLFRTAESARAEELTREIERLQADLKKAEASLVEAESGLSGSHTRADAVSSLAVTRIQVERAASRAPWRASEIEGARQKLVEAERQVGEARFGAALFFVYRARRVAESILEEVEIAIQRGNARLILGRSVNLRAGPSTSLPVLAVLDLGTPVFPRAREGQWTLVQVSGGPAGWVHRSLLGDRLKSGEFGPASPLP